MNVTHVTLASKYTSKSYTTQSKRTVNMFMLTVDLGEHTAMALSAHWMMGARRNATRVYCDIKVRMPGGGYRYGAGFVDGSGYHKESAALQEALDNAGVQLFDGSDRIDVGGTGERAMLEALRHIARLLYPDFTIDQI